jgi:DNA-binding transcriptional LysR family regulator
MRWAARIGQFATGYVSILRKCHDRNVVANPDGVIVDPLLTETMVVALPSGHPLARRARDAEMALSLKALADETFILFGRPQGAITLSEQYGRFSMPGRGL